MWLKHENFHTDSTPHLRGGAIADLTLGILYNSLNIQQQWSLSVYHSCNIQERSLFKKLVDTCCKFIAYSKVMAIDTFKLQTHTN